MRSKVELTRLLKSVDMFAGLTDEQISLLAGIFEERELAEREVLFRQGDPGDNLCLIQAGFVEVSIESDEHPEGRIIVSLGPGQSVGEMSLIDRGRRSASVRAALEGTRVAVVEQDAFDRFCEQNTDIGYRVMRNIAADLSFRLRHRDRAV